MADLQPNETQSRPAYSVQQITLATFLGGPLAGCWLLALNYRLFQQRANAWIASVAGIPGTIAVVAISLVLPTWFPNIVLPVVYTLFMRGLADSLQGTMLEEHGGPPGSWWIVVGISLLCVALLFGAVFAFVWLFPNGLFA